MKQSLFLATARISKRTAAVVSKQLAAAAVAPEPKQTSRRLRAESETAAAATPKRKRIDAATIANQSKLAATDALNQETPPSRLQSRRLTYAVATKQKRKEPRSADVPKQKTEPPWPRPARRLNVVVVRSEESEGGCVRG